MSDPNFQATITANSNIYSAWESLTLERRYCDMTVFQFSPTEGSYGYGYENFGLIPGNDVSISLAGQQITKGKVTTRSASYDDRSRQIIIAGKAKIGDTVKSSVVKPGTYDGYTFEQATNAVLAPHGISLIMKNPPPTASKPFANLAVQYGETVAEFIQRIAMMRGIFIWDDKDGNLVAGAANTNSAPVADLVEGQNILRASLLWDNQLAFAKYSGVGQQPGTDNNWPPRAISATATNSGASDNSFHLFLAEHPGDAEDMVARVNYEMIRASWSTLQASITVVGWTKKERYVMGYW